MYKLKHLICVLIMDTYIRLHIHIGKQEHRDILSWLEQPIDAVSTPTKEVHK